MARRSYEGDGVVVHWNSERCIHTAICLKALPGVFDTGRRPWVSVDAADADAIATAIERCPSGALTYERTDGSPGEQPDIPTTIVPWPNGPLMVRGEVELLDRRGDIFMAGPHMTLCRCGDSKNHPYCDLSHVGVGFRNYPRAVDPDRGKTESPEEVGPEFP